MKKQKNNTGQNKIKISKIFLLIGITVILVLLFYLALRYSGLWDRFDSAEEISAFIKSTGIYGIAVFFALQFLQVTILPLPGFVTTVAGSVVFGPLTTSLCSSVAIILGSLFAFFLGRRYGTKLLKWCVGEEDCKKYKALLTECKYAFFLMMLFPFFPDDILCLVAGVTNMSTKFFVITNLITRPIAVFCTCYIGSGYLIPFKGWGIYVWIVIGILTVISFLLTTKYQSNIEDFFVKLDKKIKLRFKNKKSEIK